MYTNSLQFVKPPTFSGKVCKQPNLVQRLPIDPDSPVYARAKKEFSQRSYLYPAPPIFLGQTKIQPPTNTFVLRLPIKTPASDWCLPIELSWLEEFVSGCASYQQLFPQFEERFFYLTVRSGSLKSQNDERFHVDGFQGALVPRHLPEQNYLYADENPTLFALQPYFCEDLDPSKHNVHDFFDAHTNRSLVWSGVPRGVYLFDPYHVHARPTKVVEPRTMIRLSCLTIEIRDDTNTKNPALPMPTYQKPDPRNYLWQYPIQNPELKFGLVATNLEKQNEKSD